MIGNARIRAALIGAGAAVAAAALVSAPAAAGGHELEELKAQIQALQKRLGELEAAQKKKMEMEKAAPKAVVGGDSSGSWKLPGSDTSISFSGYAKADVIYDFGNDGGDTFWVAGIPLDGTAAAKDGGAVSMHAKQSRIRFDSRTPTDWGSLRTRLETDFYGSGGVFRMRHAFGQLGPVLVGQTWSIFGDEDTYASTVDFDGPVGVVATRRPQLRYTQGLGGGLTVQAAIEENPGGGILKAERGSKQVPTVDEDGMVTSTTEYSVDTVDALDRLPTFLTALRYRPGWGAVNLAGALRQVRYGDDSEIAHGYHIGAHVNVSGDTQLLATFNASKGVSDYILYAGKAATLDAGGALKLQDSLGGMVGIKHSLSGSLRTGLYFGWMEHDTDASASPAVRATENESLQTVHATVAWNPVPQVTVGVEFMHGWREANPQVTDGAVDPMKSTSGEDSRVQLGVQYSF